MSKKDNGKFVFWERPLPSKVCSCLDGAHIFTFFDLFPKTLKNKAPGLPKITRLRPQVLPKSLQKVIKKHIPKKEKKNQVAISADMFRQIIQNDSPTKNKQNEVYSPCWPSLWSLGGFWGSNGFPQPFCLCFPHHFLMFFPLVVRMLACRT